MRTHLWKSLLVLAGLMSMLALGSAAIADDKPDDGDKGKKLVVGCGPDNLSINADGSELTISYSEDGKSQVTVVDLEQVSHLVGESLSAAAEALAEMQLEIRMGDDNHFSFAFDDQEWEVDVDAMMSEVSQALNCALDEVETSEWAHHRHYRTDHDENLDEMHGELQDELKALRGELKDLKKELARLKANKE